MAADKWYHLHYEYSKNDTAFVQLSDRNDTLILENGINAEDHGPLAKSSTPLSIGNAYLDADCSDCTYFSGWIDNIDIYNYAATVNTPEITVFPIGDSVSVTVDDPTVETHVTSNGEEEVKLWYRYVTDTGTTDSSTKVLDPDHTGNDYSGTLPLPETAGVVIQYGVATSNDFGEVTYDGPFTTQVLPNNYDYYGNTKLNVDFESGGGEIEDHSPYQWTVKKKGFQGVPTFSDDAKWGDYSMRFSSRDSSFLEITPPYSFLNEKSFVVQVTFKSFQYQSQFSGEIKTDTTWKKSDSPILVTGDVRVSSEVRLTIDPGVTVYVHAGGDDQNLGRLSESIEFLVDGTLDAVGTEADSVRFVSNAASPAKGDWYGIRQIASLSAVEIDYVIV